MKKLDKKQLAIFGVLGVFIVIFIFLLKNTFSSDTSLIEQGRNKLEGGNALPVAPKKNQKQFQGKLAASQNGEEKSRTVDLDIFKVDKEDETKKVSSEPVVHREEVKETIAQAKTTQPKPKRVPKRTEAKPEKSTPPVYDEYDDFSLSSNLSDETNVARSEAAGDEYVGSFGIKAVIHDNQTVKDGQRVTVRVLESVDYGGKSIEAGRFLYTTAKFSDGRVFLDFSNIRYDNGESVSKKLVAFDQTDHSRGLYSEQLSEQEYSGEAAQDGMNSTYNPNKTFAQSVAEGFAKKKIKELSVNLRDNTTMIIREI